MLETTFERMRTSALLLQSKSFSHVHLGVVVPPSGAKAAVGGCLMNAGGLLSEARPQHPQRRVVRRVEDHSETSGFFICPRDLKRGIASAELCESTFDMQCRTYFYGGRARSRQWPVSSRSFIYLICSGSQESRGNVKSQLMATRTASSWTSRLQSIVGFVARSSNK